MKIAVFTKNLSNPAYAAARVGADRAAALFGAQVTHFVPTVPDDPAQQSELVSQALAQSPDAFVFTPVHATKVDGAIDAIGRAGIPMVSFISRLAPGRCVSHVGSADARMGADIARYLFGYLHGHGDVVIIEGPADSITSIERVRSFDEVAASYPDIRIVARCSGGYQRAPARAAFESLLPNLPRIGAVLAANDIMAIGALDALQAAGRRAAVVGVNAIPEAIAAISRGEMVATADFNAMQMCFLATECAIRHLRGESVPVDVELPVAIVDRANFQRWNLPYEQRPTPTLREFLQ